MRGLPCPGLQGCSVLTKRGPLEKGMGNHLSNLALRTTWTVWKGKKIYMILKDELLRSVVAQHATGEEWRNNSRKNEEMEPKQKQCSVATGDGSKVWCYKEQYCIGNWNVRSTNQGKLEVVKGDSKSRHWHFRNQQTKMDWNGWIQQRWPLCLLL